MDPQLEEYLKNKYGEDYEGAAKQNYDDAVSTNKVAGAFASLGDVIAGRGAGASDDYFQKLNQQAKSNTIGKLAEDQKTFMAKAGFDNEQKQAKIKQDAFDPMSNQSVTFRNMMAAKFPDVAKSYGDSWENVSAGDLDNIFKPLQLKEQMEARKEQARILAGDKKDLRDQRAYEKQEKQDEKNEQLMTAYGKARTLDDAKQIKEAAVIKKNFDAKLDELIKLRESGGGGGKLLDRTAVNRAKQLSKDLLLDYKSLSGLGVLSQSDMSILNSIIPDDPLEFRNPIEAFRGEDSILSNMKSFKADKEKDFQNRLTERLRDAPTQLATPASDPDAEKYAQMHGIPYEKAAEIINKRRSNKIAGGQ